MCIYCTESASYVGGQEVYSKLQLQFPTSRKPGGYALGYNFVNVERGTDI
jgi:hypothetical protein